MIRVWDGFLSILAAVIAAFLVGVPAWGCFLAVRAELIPIWSWAAILGLGFVGVLMVGAFLRKAARGVHPLRERRR